MSDYIYDNPPHSGGDTNDDVLDRATEGYYSSETRERFLRKVRMINPQAQTLVEALTHFANLDHPHANHNLTNSSTGAFDSERASYFGVPLKPVDREGTKYSPYGHLVLRIEKDSRDSQDGSTPVVLELATGEDPWMSGYMVAQFKTRLSPSGIWSENESWEVGFQIRGQTSTLMTVELNNIPHIKP